MPCTWISKHTMQYYTDTQVHINAHTDIHMWYRILLHVMENYKRMEERIHQILGFIMNGGLEDIYPFFKFISHLKRTEV